MLYNLFRVTGMFLSARMFEKDLTMSEDLRISKDPKDSSDLGVSQTQSLDVFCHVCKMFPLKAEN